MVTSNIMVAKNPRYSNRDIASPVTMYNKQMAVWKWSKTNKQTLENVCKARNLKKSFLCGMNESMYKHA